MNDKLPSIEPLRSRWEANPDPGTIVIPGLDTTAPLQDQVEQIEQLITIKLQNIDANFSMIQQILSSKLLPAFKRYAVNTEPVREAAKFWVSFFEQAAEVHIPTSEDYTPTYERTEEMEETTETTSYHGTSAANTTADTITTGTFDPNVTPSDNSFMPGQAAISSTPVASSSRRGRDIMDPPNFTAEDESAASWVASMESPLERLDREIQDLQPKDLSQNSSATLSFSRAHESYAAPTPGGLQHDAVYLQASPRKGKGKSLTPARTLREKTLRQNFRAAGDAPQVSPLKVKPKTPRRNPYVPPHTPRGAWDGIVDLGKSVKSTTPGVSTWEWESDSEDDMTLPPGMSPPVMMDFARPPRSAAKLGRTPVRAAAARIGQDLVSAVGRRGYGGAPPSESSYSTAPTPPSMSRYVKQPSRSMSTINSSLEQMMQQVGLNTGTSVAGHDSFQDSPAGSAVLAGVATHGGVGSDSDSDSEEYEEGHTGAPSAAFLMASQRQRSTSDDSFGSNQSSDSLSGDEGGGANAADAPVHPFANVFSAPQPEGDDGFDDSFDDDFVGDEDADEPTVFGVPPAQRAAMAAAAARAGGEGPLRMLGQGLLEDTIGIGGVQESPTPWGVGRGT